MSSNSYFFIGITSLTTKIIYNFLHRLKHLIKGQTWFVTLIAYSRDVNQILSPYGLTEDQNNITILRRVLFEHRNSSQYYYQTGS
nr:MAG TPA: hypothetical protein [Caudoviricetes sp.]